MENNQSCETEKQLNLEEFGFPKDLFKEDEEEEDE